MISTISSTDLLIQQWLQGRSSFWLEKACSIITNLGSPVAFMLISILVFIWLFWRRRWLEAIFAHSCLITAWILMAGLKNVIARPRPIGESFTIATGFSFPSGHAMLSLAYYGFLGLLLVRHLPSKYRPMLLVFFGILILSIGFSRIYLNVHYTSDVLAGYCFGALTLGVNWWAMKYTMKRSSSYS